MSKFEDAWALVVGIDIYDDADVRPLSGAAMDAVQAVRWLRTIGLRDSHIKFHVSPRPESRASVDDLDLPKENVKDAQFDSIWASIAQLSREAGDHLFIVLSGHGLYDAASGRLFLTQDYGLHGNYAKNLGLDEFINYFLSFSFGEQYLFFDGCQNYSTRSVKQRSAVEAQPPPDRNYTPREENGLVAVFAASMGQFAYEEDGRAAMLRRLLDELDPNTLNNLDLEDLRQDAIIYDWNTGERSVDLRKIFKLVHDEVVQRAQEQNRRQRPALKTYGWAESHLELPLFNLEHARSCRLVTDITPREALPSINKILVRIRGPRWERCLPAPSAPISLPDECRVPMHVEIEPDCFLKRGAPWSFIRLGSTIPIAGEQEHIVLRLEPMVPQQVPPGLDLYNVRLVKEDDGSTVEIRASLPEIQHDFVTQLADRLPSKRYLLPPVRWHDKGADIRVSTEAESIGAEVAIECARAISRVKERGLQVSIAPPGEAIEENVPNLAFQMPREGAQQLAGYLANSDVVRISGSSTVQHIESGRQGWSLAELSDLGAVHVEPGRNRIHVELPWGSWTRFVDVPNKGVVTCTLPQNVGTMPLRHRWSFGNRGGLEGIVCEKFPAGQIVLRGNMAWATLPEAHLLIDNLADLPVIEPYSTTSSIEWDLLITTDRLDALDQKRIEQLCHGHSRLLTQDSQGAIFALAVAYSAYGARLVPELQQMLHRLPAQAAQTVDARLLRLEATRLAGGSPDPDQIAGVLAEINENRVPVFRWGMPIVARYGGMALEGFQSVFEFVSPSSVWTVMRFGR